MDILQYITIVVDIHNKVYGNTLYNIHVHVILFICIVHNIHGIFIGVWSQGVWSHTNHDVYKFSFL